MESYMTTNGMRLDEYGAQPADGTLTLVVAENWGVIKI